MKKSIVTGGAGFIGSHLSDLLLKNNHELIIIDNLSSGNLKNIKHLIGLENVNFVDEDLNDLHHSSEIFDGIDYVFHLAGLGDIVPSIEKPKLYFQANYMGTLNLLKCLKDKNIKKFYMLHLQAVMELLRCLQVKITEYLLNIMMSKYQAEELIFRGIKFMA